MRRCRYGLIVADWNVPPMTGYDLLQRIRADQDLCETPFVMMSSQEQAHCFPAAHRAGANPYLVRTFGAVDLCEAIRTIYTASAAPRR